VLVEDLPMHFDFFVLWWQQIYDVGVSRSDEKALWTIRSTRDFFI
jgi:hypothetical protein